MDGAIWEEGIRICYGDFVELLISLGVFQFYKTPLYIAFFVLLALSTLVCTLNRRMPVWQRVFTQADRYSLSPVTLDELDDITIEISILSPFHLVTDLERIQVGALGLQIYKDGQTGLLTPQIVLG